MFITSLTEAEMLVDSRPDLEWDGWDMVRYKKNSRAQFDPKGVYKNGSWCFKSVFPLDKNGWSVPERFRGNDA